MTGGEGRAPTTSGVMTEHHNEALADPHEPGIEGFKSTGKNEPKAEPFGARGPARSGYRQASNRPEGRVHDGARNIGRLAFERYLKNITSPRRRGIQSLRSNLGERAPTGWGWRELAATLQGKQDELNECRAATC
jgi:hypothetical protein